MPKELIHLERLVGAFMEYWGFKKIHGRIWTHLYTSTKPLDSIQLMKRLKVSKGLMSLALRDLVKYEVIETSHVGRHGTTYYSANNDLISVISNVLKNREFEMLSQASDLTKKLRKMGSEELKKHSIDPEKVQNVLELTQSAQFILNAFLQQEPAKQHTLKFIS